MAQEPDAGTGHRQHQQHPPGPGGGHRQPIGDVGGHPVGLAGRGQEGVRHPGPGLGARGFGQPGNRSVRRPGLWASAQRTASSACGRSCER
ncbi:hypothetical protein ACFFX0_26025 [Citricoccus parietis]|uniref:Uncharacterized protein n=1 Tax=Citricoccus parietis TaxID=592307 RepID=A0ABV5G698_9MICC